MEGKATFTLKQASTGRTLRQFTEHNIVTEAMSRLLSPPGYALFKAFSWSDFIKTSLPLYKNLCGGIMLLGNTVTERADNVMLPPETVPVATAGDAYSGTLITRGSLNENESYATENGYHFTWDFGTDKANGTIKCAALTSRFFGNTGFSDAEKDSGLIMDPVTKEYRSPTAQICHAKGQYICTIDKDTHIYLQRTDANNYVFNKIKTIDTNAVGVTDSIDFTSLSQPVSSHNVTVPIDTDNFTRPFLDSSARKAYFFTKQYEVGEDKYQVDYVSVSLDDFTVSEKASWPMNKKYSYITAAALYGGRLYAVWNTDLTCFGSSGEVIETWTMPGANLLSFCIVNNVLTYIAGSRKMYSLYNNKWYGAYGIEYYGFGYSADIKPPYYPVFALWSYTSDNYDPYLGIAANYLATINNLSEPLEKTNEHTLKITYDITN